jgi:anti-anti-sigma factor
MLELKEKRLYRSIWMVLSSENKENYTVLRSNIDKINYENANKFSKLTVDLIENEKPERLAIDLQNVKYISSIGISALSVIKGISKLNNCTIVLFNLTPEVFEILEQTGVNSLFKLLETEEEVTEYFLEENGE